MPGNALDAEDAKIRLLPATGTASCQGAIGVYTVVAPWRCPNKGVNKRLGSHVNLV